MLRITNMGVLTSSSSGNNAPCAPGRLNGAPSSVVNHVPSWSRTGMSVAGSCTEVKLGMMRRDAGMLEVGLDF